MAQHSRLPLREAAIVDAAQSRLGVLTDPVEVDGVFTQMNIVLVFAGLLLGGTYQGVYSGIDGGSSVSLWFSWFNFVALLLSMLSAALAAAVLIRLPVLVRWPADWARLPAAPHAVVQQYASHSHDFGAAVEYHAKALNFVWHACTYGTNPLPLVQRIKHNVRWSFLFLDLSLVMLIPAASISLISSTKWRPAPSGASSGLCIASAATIAVWARLASQRYERSDYWYWRVVFDKVVGPSSMFVGFMRFAGTTESRRLLTTGAWQRCWRRCSRGSCWCRRPSAVAARTWPTRGRLTPTSGTRPCGRRPARLLSRGRPERPAAQSLLLQRTRW